MFHTDLAADLEDLGLSDQVRYVVSAKTIERHLAAQFAPVSSDALRQSIDIADLTAAFKQHVAEFSIDPREAALYPSTRIATIATAEPLADTWEFLDGAGRGDSGWTARFIVIADTFYARIDRNQKLITDRKPLIFGGNITVAASGEVTALEKASVSALPDDTMRARWPDSEHVKAAMEVLKGLSEPDELWRAADALRGSIPPDQLRQILQDAVQLSGAEDRIRQDMTEILGTEGGQERLRKIVKETWNWQQRHQW